MHGTRWYVLIKFGTSCSTNRMAMLWDGLVLTQLRPPVLCIQIDIQANAPIALCKGMAACCMGDVASCVHAGCINKERQECSEAAVTDITLFHCSC